MRKPIEFTSNHRHPRIIRGRTLVMKFDRMGRRVEYVETVVDPVGSTVVTNKHQRLVFDGYLQIQRLNGSDSSRKVRYI